MKRNIHRRRLTIAEEEIMLILWKRKHALIKDIMEDCTEPRPAYNTVSTVLRVMEKKGFVGHRRSASSTNSIRLSRRLSMPASCPNG